MSNSADLSDVAPASLTQDWAGHTIEMAGALLLVVASVFLISLLLRYLQTKSITTDNHLKIIQAISVGGKDRALLVQVGRDQVLLGTGNAGLVHLHTLTEPVDVEEQGPNLPEGAANFAQTLKAMAGKKSL